MKNILVILLFISSAVFAQSSNENFDSLLAKGKAEFKKNFEEQDFNSAVANLKRAVTLEPENAEAHYFLGYAYSRLNAKDGEGMIAMNLELNQRSSVEFEQVIQLTPRYTGETVVLDPYSKLTAEWGSMAMCYIHKNKLDSAVWAFNEGKRRGGFGEFFLSINRHMLSQCSKNAILMSSGDNLTIPLWYLQMVEGYRKDVAVVDISLLNTRWYPKMLRAQGLVPFDQPQSFIDTLEYVYWKDSTVSVRNKYAYKDFYWTVKTTRYNNYLQRSDRLFLSILKANEFESDIYFTMGFGEDDRLSLKEYLLPLILLDQLNTGDKKKYNFAAYKTEMTKVLELINKINGNSIDEVNFVNGLRYDVLVRLEEAHQSGNKTEVKQLIKLLDTYIPEKNFPYPSRETRNYVDYVRKRH